MGLYTAHEGKRITRILLNAWFITQPNPEGGELLNVFSLSEKFFFELL